MNDTETSPTVEPTSPNGSGVEDGAEQSIARLHEEHQVMLELMRVKRKDTWDKLAILGNVIASVVIAIAGGIVTYCYNDAQSARDAAVRASQARKDEEYRQNQLQLTQIQTIEKFLPYLTRSEEEKKAGILAIQATGNTGLASRFAEMFASRGTITALTSIATNGSRSDRKSAISSLETIAATPPGENKAAATSALSALAQREPAGEPLAMEALARVFEERRQFVVEIEKGTTTGRSANGLIVSRRFILCTSNEVGGVHERELTIRTTQGERIPTSVALVSPDGLALLEVVGSAELPSPRVVLASVPNVGDPVVVLVWSAAGGSRTTLGGTVSAVGAKTVDILLPIPQFALAGGPALNAAGQVIGIVTHMLVGDSGNERRCVRVDTVREFLVASGVLRPPTPPTALSIR